MIVVAGIVLLTLGVSLVLVAAIGLVRLPDAFQRMHAATKAGTLGTTLIVGGALVLGDVTPGTGFLTILFLLLTLPTGAQLLGRAAYVAGEPLVGLTAGDPLEGVLERNRDSGADGD